MLFDLVDDCAAELASRRTMFRSQAAAGRCRIHLADGRWIRLAERRTRDAGIVGIRTDITERKHAEEALTAAQARLVDAIESMSDGFALFDGDDRYVMTNTNYRRLYADRMDLFRPGTRYEDMLRGSIDRGRDLGGEEPETWIRRLVDWHRSCAEPLERQGPDGRWIRCVERRTRDGGIVGIRADITPSKTAEAMLVRKVEDLEAAQQRLQKLSQDLTVMAEELAAARDAAEEKADALVRSEARFRDFALTSSHWLWETDAEHRFSYVSEGVRTFGFSRRSLIGRTRLEIAVDAGSEPEKWGTVQAILDKHEPFRDFIFAWRNPAGGEGVASVSGDPLFDGEGGFLGYRGTGRDITPQIHAENALREAKQAAEAASLAKSQFLANMSHELRTPLNAIIGFSDLMKSELLGPIGNQTYAGYIGDIHGSGKHLLDIISDILDLAKVDAGKLQLREEAGVDPCRIAEACVALLREHARAGGVRLEVEVREQPPLIVADPTRLKQILLNLLSNAIKFTAPGGAITLVLRRGRGRHAVFEVSDSGFGMTAAEIEIALQPFGQVDGGFERKHAGTGLGLPLARRLAELHGGSLSISSEKGRGSTVSVVLPAGGSGTPLVEAAE